MKSVLQTKLTIPNPTNGDFLIWYEIFFCITLKIDLKFSIRFFPLGKSHFASECLFNDCINFWRIRVINITVLIFPMCLKWESIAFNTASLGNLHNRWHKKFQLYCIIQYLYSNQTAKIKISVLWMYCTLTSNKVYITWSTIRYSLLTRSTQECNIANLLSHYSLVEDSYNVQSMQCII